MGEMTRAIQKGCPFMGQDPYNHQTLLLRALLPPKLSFQVLRQHLYFLPTQLDSHVE